MKWCVLVGAASSLMLLAGCVAVTDSQNLSDDRPGCQSFLTSEQPAPYRCSVAPAAAATVTPKRARNGNPYFQIVFDPGTSLQLSSLDGSTLLRTWERHCQSPQQFARDIRTNQRALVEAEMTCLVDRTLQDSKDCPNDWYWVNPDGSAPLSEAPARVEKGHWVSYVACHTPKDLEEHFAWPNAGNYFILDYAHVHLTGSFACSEPTLCAPGERIRFQGTSGGLAVGYGQRLNPYLALEFDLLLAGINLNNDLTATPNEASTYLSDYGATRVGLRGQYPVGSRAALFARFAFGYQWAQYNYGTASVLTNPGQGTTGHGLYELLGGVEYRFAGPIVLRATYTPGLTFGGLRSSVWTLGLLLAS